MFNWIKAETEPRLRHKDNKDCYFLCPRCSFRCIGRTDLCNTCGLILNAPFPTSTEPEPAKLVEATGSQVVKHA
ncbi:MAG: hypothetical protein IPM23_16135 [Candidatus Melainabacteria bacterium]|nr:hypothetical protein [Candidatus Melainabacteria bacterium]